MSGPRIHPTALVAPGAELADDVEIAPYAIIGAHVCIGRGTRVGEQQREQGVGAAAALALAAGQQDTSGKMRCQCGMEIALHERHQVFDKQRRSRA